MHWQTYQNTNTRLEQLPNEVLLHVFEYADTRDLFYGFWQLNRRFTQLLHSLRHRSLTVEKSESKLIACFGCRIYKLIVDTCLDIDFTHLPNLHSLILYDVTEAHLAQIRTKFMPSLTYLSIPPSNTSWQVRQLVCNIFTSELASLTCVNLRYSFPCDTSRFKSYSLRSMTACCLFSGDVLEILALCPNLSRLRVRFEWNDFKLFFQTPPLVNHPLKSFILTDPYSMLTSSNIDTLLKNMPNVEDVRLTFNCDSSFIHCLQMVVKYLPSLHRFGCHVEMTSDDEMTSIEIIQRLHPCFSRIQCDVDEFGYRTYTAD